MAKRANFPATLPNVHTKYCFQCGAASVEKLTVDTVDGPRVQFYCKACHHIADRVNIWDPHMIQYFDTCDNLVHEGAGIIIENGRGELLFFLRTKYPFLWTIPGGHMTPSEKPKQAALREAFEEVGILLDDARLIFEGTIEGDECMGGADIHTWHLYHATITDPSVMLDEEGSRFAWYSLSALPKNITYPVRYLLQQDAVISALTKGHHGA